MFSRIAFGFQNGSYFLRRIFRVPFVDDIPKRRKIAVRFAVVVYTVVYRYEMHVLFDEIHFRVISDFQIISAETRHILDDDPFYFAAFHVFNHPLKIGTVKIRSRIAVVSIKSEPVISVFFRILFEYAFLIYDTVAVALQVVVAT